MSDILKAIIELNMHFSFSKIGRFMMRYLTKQ